MIHRRQFLGTVGAATAAALTPSARGASGDASPNLSDFPSLRANYPRATEQVYLDSASHCPLSRHTRAGIDRYHDFHMYGPGEGRGEYASMAVREARNMFARLIHAKPSEIAFVQNTKAGEAIVIQGLDIGKSGGNIATNDLHYAGSLHNFIGLKKNGLDVRIAKARDWVIDPADMEAIIDKKTKLVAITLLSNVNGHMEDAKTICEIAHASGAYVYADIIQAAGAIPMDVKALGLDFAACSNYKWLQGVRGAGYLYVREELQGSLVKDRQYPGYVRFNYPPWVETPDASLEEFPYKAPQDATRYQAGNVNYAAYAGQYESFKVMKGLGMAKILAHSMELVDRIRKELPEKMYRCITPPGTRGPVIVFMPKDYEDAGKRVKKANIRITLTGNRMRISPSVYNNQQDVDRLLEALS